MSPDTRLVNAGLNIRARNAIARRISGKPKTAITLEDVAKLSRRTLMLTPNCGAMTVYHIQQTLLKANLYLSDDTPGMWATDRELCTRILLELADTQRVAVVRALCDRLPSNELLTVCNSLGMHKKLESLNGKEATNPTGNAEEAAAAPGQEEVGTAAASEEDGQAETGEQEDPGGEEFICR